MDTNKGSVAPDWNGGDVIYNRKLKKTANYWGNGGWMVGRMMVDGTLTDETGEWVKVMYMDGKNMTDELWLLEDCEWVSTFMGLSDVKQT